MKKDEERERDLVFCDDSKPMEPHPPLTVAEQKHHDDFWATMFEKYLKDAVPVEY